MLKDLFLKMDGSHLMFKMAILLNTLACVFILISAGKFLVIFNLIFVVILCFQYGWKMKGECK